ncbi:MAG TPA: hypothetical protein VHV83_18270, partial [Armatimonadota bacterium]|nr:hypothetical protein [Armatimonadota bacterium]
REARFQGHLSGIKFVNLNGLFQDDFILSVKGTTYRHRFQWLGQGYCGQNSAECKGRHYLLALNHDVNCCH